MRKVYTIECDRCGTPVSYKSRSGYRNAKKRHENGAFLCKKCKGKSTAPNLIFTSKTTAVIVCPKCERAKELHGRWHINDYIKRYGRDCEGYVCPECRKAPPLGDKVCSVCGKHEPHLNSESKRKFLKRYENRLYICSECRKKRTEESHVLTCRKCGEKRVLKT
jgi:DNA-directed RNA polymerase subunit RPC12/RpoP